MKNNYVCTHYSAADLCFFDDFDELKKDLSIINKSFVTLGNPLKIGSSYVHFRDTILLAPAGLSTLEALGRLYNNEGDFSKRDISIEYKSRMSKFLADDKKGFEDYAIQDAVITLKHAISMEQFNLEIKQFGVPVTLASVGRNFVLES